MTKLKNQMQTTKQTLKSVGLRGFYHRFKDETVVTFWNITSQLIAYNSSKHLLKAGKIHF